MDWDRGDEEESEESGAAASGNAESARSADAAAAGSGDPSPVGVKLGSTRTVLVHPDTDGEMATTTTLTCLATYEDAITGEERLLYGEEAATEYPDEVEFMLRSGLPEDDERADLAGRFFREVVTANGVDPDSVVVYAIPSIDNEQGLANLERVIDDSGIGDRAIRSYPESLCGAIPAMGDGLEAIESIFVGVNLGSTNLEASAYRRGEQLSHFATGAVTGNEVDRRIANLVEEETQGRVNIDGTTAREYKEQHADFESFEPFTDVIQQPGGGSHEFTIEWSVMEALDEYVDEAVDELANTFLSEFANDSMKTYNLALDNDIVLTGGMTCIPGLVDEFESRLADELQRDVTVIAPDDPVTAAARGAQRIADRLVDRGAY
ncbi:hypothetical protein [Haloglomus halophilum]|uniref:hypothetical protein n=1 Tax=Haloglomus halophilum TaxID=2962672 RepID=UPI0020C9822E|nr:hypothetical protein [Haloglomus halophilum]